MPGLQRTTRPLIIYPNSTNENYYARLERYSLLYSMALQLRQPGRAAHEQSFGLPLWKQTKCWLLVYPRNASRISSK